MQAKQKDWWLDEGEPSEPGLKSIGHALGGGLVGAAQGVNDLGANVAQSLFDLYGWANGTKPFQAPRADLRGYAPQSEVGQSAAKIGETIAPIVASPALATEAAFGKMLFGGRVIPRLIADMLAGAAESKTGERGIGAVAGLASPAIGRIAREIKTTPLTEYGATKRLNKADKLAEQRNVQGLTPSIDFLRHLEYQMQSPKLRPASHSINSLLGEAASGTYPAYRNLTSELGNIARDIRYPAKQQGKGIMGIISNLISQPQSTAQERLIASQLEKLRDLYKSDVAQALAKMGNSDIAALEKRGSQDYMKYKRAKPYVRNAAIGAATLIPGFEALKHLF